MNTTSELLQMQAQAASAAQRPRADAGAKEPAGGPSEFEKLLARQSEQAEAPPQGEEPARDETLSGDGVKEQLALLAMLNGGAPVIQPYVEETADGAACVQPGEAAAPAMAQTPDLALENRPVPQQSAQSPVSGKTQTAEPAEPIPTAVQSPAEPAAETAQPRQTAAPASLTEQTGGEAQQDAWFTRGGRPPVLTKERDGMQAETTAGSVDSTAQPLFRDVEAVPVKVGETPVTVDTQAPDMDAQLTDQLEGALKDGAQEVKLRLTPANLGAVTVQLTRTQDGALQVAIQTTTEKAAELLTRHSASLGAMLQESTQAPVQVEVQRQSEAQQQQQQQQSQEQRQGRQDPRQQNRQQNRAQSEAFMHQLRLGLVPLDERVS